MNKRSEILAKADELINGDRQADYGPPRENFDRIAAIWSIILGQTVSAQQVCLCMAGLKMARLVNSNHEDSAVDAAGYLALGAELDTR